MDSAHLESFQSNRALLFSIAYRMTGSLDDAEDIVQDAWLRYVRTPVEKIRDAKFFLIRLVSRAAIDTLRRLKREREAYKGVWLPDAILDDYMENPALDFEKQHAISYALLHTLERLNPVERAAFLLRDVFDYDYAEIALILGKAATACRKLVSRARVLVKDEKVRFAVNPASQAKLLWQFLKSVNSGDLKGLENLLADDARLYSDGGGRVKAAILPIRTRRKVARFLLGVAKKKKRGVLMIKETLINGSPGFVFVRGGRIENLLSCSFDARGIAGIRTMINPDKIPAGIRVPMRLADYWKLTRLI